MKKTEKFVSPVKSGLALIVSLVVIVASLLYTRAGHWLMYEYRLPYLTVLSIIVWFIVKIRQHIVARQCSEDPNCSEDEEMSYYA